MATLQRLGYPRMAPREIREDIAEEEARQGTRIGSWQRSMGGIMYDRCRVRGLSHAGEGSKGLIGQWLMNMVGSVEA